MYEDGPRLTGPEGVVDKDLAAAILARDVQASVLLVLTDVAGVYRGYGTEEQELLPGIPAAEAKRMLGAGEFGEGSMGPKVQAAVGFVESGGERAVIARGRDPRPGRPGRHHHFLNPPSRGGPDRAGTLARVRLRVLVYNVKGFRFGVDRIAAVVGEYEPDLALVNECGTGRRLRRLARAVDMDAAAPRLWLFLRTVRNAVLIRPPWRVVGFHLHRFERAEALHPRGALVAQVGRAGFRVSALSVHLGLSPQERRRHAEEITDLTLTLPGAFLVGGDMNEGPEGTSVAWIAARMWDAWAVTGAATGASGGATYPSERPTARIDYLFASEHFDVLDAAVPDSPEAGEASDHRPLVVDLELREQQPAAR